MNIGVEFLINMAMLELSAKDNVAKNKGDFDSINGRIQSIKNGMCDDTDCYMFSKIGTITPPTAVQYKHKRH